MRHQYLKRVIDLKIGNGTGGKFHMEYGINPDKLQQVADTYFLKSNLITKREDWDDIKVTQTQAVRDRGGCRSFGTTCPS